METGAPSACSRMATRPSPRSAPPREFPRAATDVVDARYRKARRDDSEWTCRSQAELNTWRKKQARLRKYLIIPMCSQGATSPQRVHWARDDEDGYHRSNGFMFSHDVCLLPLLRAPRARATSTDPRDAHKILPKSGPLLSQLTCRGRRRRRSSSLQHTLYPRWRCRWRPGSNSSPPSSRS